MAEIIKQGFAGLGGTILVRGPSPEDVISAATRQKVLQAAAAGGLTKAGLSDMPKPYPIDAEGKYSDDLALGRTGTPPAAYEAEYKVGGMP